MHCFNYDLDGDLLMEGRQRLDEHLRLQEGRPSVFERVQGLIEVTMHVFSLWI
jgi:hypothetical protein